MDKADRLAAAVETGDCQRLLECRRCSRRLHVQNAVYDGSWMEWASTPGTAIVPDPALKES